MVKYTEEDVGNIILLEHINIQVPDQKLATLFYVVGMGLTRDPYLNVGLQNMWVNIGEQQFHLPTRAPQVIDGHIGLVMPEMETLRDRLVSIKEPLKDTQFLWFAAEDRIEITGPWGNRFRCYPGGAIFGDMALGIAYVEFRVPVGAAVPIARFYEKIFEAPTTIQSIAEGKLAAIKVGRNQSLRFREVKEPIRPYDGHHLAVYVTKFSWAFNFLKARNLILEEVSNHQFRFKEIVDPDDHGSAVFFLEHEVRSLHHPMFGRRFINREPRQSQRNYLRGGDGLLPYRR